MKVTTSGQSMPQNGGEQVQPQQQGATEPAPPPPPMPQQMSQQMVSPAFPQSFPGVMQGIIMPQPQAFVPAPPAPLQQQGFIPGPPVDWGAEPTFLLPTTAAIPQQVVMSTPVPLQKSVTIPEELTVRVETPPTTRSRSRSRSPRRETSVVEDEKEEKTQ